MTSYTATYSPEDNKLRLYASSRLDAETFARIKAAGFRWAPRQELFVAPAWSPEREDLLTSLAGEIEAEEMTLAERAAAKAERLDQLAAKRAAESNAYSRRAAEISERFYMGQPILVGHHSERRARKDQERMHQASDKAAQAHKAANYWLYRAEGVEAHANMKSDPRTRANRIGTLLAELRDLQRAINAAHRALAIWDKLTTPEQIRHAVGNMDSRATLTAMGDYYALERGEKSPEQVRGECIERATLRIEGPTRRRWIEHTLNRLGYERAQLGEVARYSGDLSPVILQAFARAHGAEKPEAVATLPGVFTLSSPVPLPLHLGEGTTLELSADGWRDLMQAVGYEVPAAKPRRASSKPAPAPLFNLSRDQAEQLQRVWNLHMAASCKAHQQAKPNEVRAMDQARFSANSRGDYAPLKTVEIAADGRQVRGSWQNRQWVLSGEPIARVRVYTGGGDFYKPAAVVHITDKPAKPLPIDLDAIEAAALAAVEAQQVAA